MTATVTHVRLCVECATVAVPPTRTDDVDARWPPTLQLDGGGGSELGRFRPLRAVKHGMKWLN